LNVFKCHTKKTSPKNGDPYNSRHCQEDYVTFCTDDAWEVREE